MEILPILTQNRFLKQLNHHEQYEELFQPKHIAQECVDFHDLHVSVIKLRKVREQTTRTLCENCNHKEAQYQASTITREYAAFIDCYMPRITKSAVASAAKFTGDIRTHMMAIDPIQIGKFTDDGKPALSQLRLELACRSCHVEGGIGIAHNYTDSELKQEAYNYYARPATLEE